jgi:hypothetical protein
VGTRLGLILPHGGESILPVVKQICLAELHWSDRLWQRELADYQSLIVHCYSLPSIESIPDWRALLLEVKIKRKSSSPERRNKIIRNSSILAGMILIGAIIIALLWRRNKQTKQISGAVKDDYITS